jgi:hypothetical protein
VTRERHLTYAEAATLLSLSVDMLRRAAARRAGDPRRLKVKRYGHRTVRIVESELMRWDSGRIAA